MEPLSLNLTPPPSLGPSLEALAEQAHDTGALERTAQDFESLLASLLLKEMRQTLDPQGLFGSDGSDSYGSLFDLYLGQHLAQAQGLGIGEMVRQQLAAGSVAAPLAPETVEP